MSALDGGIVRAPSRLVVVGASAGGVPALSTLVAGLGSDLNAAILVVLHVPANGRSVLPDILERAGRFPAAHPRDREPMLAGHIYVAPPDRHLLVHDGVLRVTRGAWENGYRPSIDALFRSAAHWYGPGVVGVVLSGALDDGAAGLASIYQNGGFAIVQDPRDATVRDMPEHALGTVPRALVLPVNEIPATINRVAATDVEGKPRPPVRPTAEDPDLAAAEGIHLEIEGVAPGPAGLVCPDCGGSLFDVSGENGTRYRCRVGHGWTAEALSEAHGRQLEQALWAAVRVLEENRSVQRRLVTRAVESGREQVALRMAARQEQRDRLVAMLRAAIDQFGSAIPGEQGDEMIEGAPHESFEQEHDDEAVM